MYLFADQLGYAKCLVHKLHRMVLFIVLVYTSVWLKAPVAADAPANDLQLYRTLVKYKSVDHDVGDAAIKVLRRHLWYLKSPVVVFSLFSDQVSEEQKESISKKLAATPRVPMSDHSPTDVVLDDTSQLEDMVDEASWRLFDATSTGYAWLSSPPHSWSSNKDYRILEGFVRPAKVTNDVAERGLGMLKTFVGAVKDEHQFQSLLQAVENHRTRLPEVTKAAMSTL